MLRWSRRPGTRETAEPSVQEPPGPLDQLLVSTSLLDLSLRGLRGYAPSEGLCYWFGHELAPSLALATVVAFPRIYSDERSFKLAEGQMSQLATRSHRDGLWLLAQLHTHPADEPHSHADENWAPVTREGFLSLVLPFSAQFSSTRDPRWSCYECDGAGQWQQVDTTHVQVFEDVWLPSGRVS